MHQRIYHGLITPTDIARNLQAAFDRGNLQAQQLGSGNKIAIQISSRQTASSGGQTALSILIQSIEDGVAVQVGQQALLGVAASLGTTALSALRNPLSLLNRFDDLAQDIENIQLTDEVWKIIEKTVKSLGANYELSDRLRRLICDYCNTPNPVGEASCIACGAPLGNVQPQTCRYCGYVVRAGDKICPNCARALV